MHGVAQRETAVLHVGGLSYASEKAVVERRLGAQPGVLAVDANPVAQTATVEFDREQTDVRTLKRWVEECGYHCAGQSTPGHICDPLAAEPLAPAHDHAAVERADARRRRDRDRGGGGRWKLRGSRRGSLSALAQTAEVDRSCALLEEALTTAQTAGVQDGISRVRHVRREHLERWADSSAVQRLDQALAS